MGVSFGKPDVRITTAGVLLNIGSDTRIASIYEKQK
jgi:hypothetical protein